MSVSPRNGEASFESCSSVYPELQQCASPDEQFNPFKQNGEYFVEMGLHVQEKTWQHQPFRRVIQNKLLCSARKRQTRVNALVFTYRAVVHCTRACTWKMYEILDGATYCTRNRRLLVESEAAAVVVWKLQN